LHLEATYFDQEIEDAIEFDLVSFSGYLQSSGLSSSTGVELAASVPFGGRWELLANWTYNETEDTAGQQRVRRPKNLGNFGLQYVAANERLNFLANYRVSRDAIDTTFVSTVRFDYSCSISRSPSTHRSCCRSTGACRTRPTRRTKK
jgi:vitamin B12 transporter